MFAFLALILTLLAFVQSGFSLRHSKAHRHGGLTNAQRFARGLPPAPPKHLFGSRSESARRSSVSASPGQTVYGTIQFTTDSGTFYLGSDGVVQSTSSSAIGLQYTDPGSSTMPVTLEEIDTLNVPVGVYFAFCANDLVTLSSSGYTYVVLFGALGQTSGGSPPTSLSIDGGGTSDGETAVFMIDPTTGDITVTWVNPDNTIATDIVLSTDGAYLYMGSGSGYSTLNMFSAVDSITFTQM